MAIKRVTIYEIDDSPDTNAATGSLNLPPEIDIAELKEKNITNLPDYAHTEETEPPKDNIPHQSTVGRTFPDLIIEFVNNPKAMGTTLMIIPFFIFIMGDEINSFKELIYPLMMGIIFNVCWFGIPFLRFLRR